MSAMPFVQFYPSDWLGGTRGLSAVETGVYITLVMLMYERGEPLRDDHSRLARACGASNSAFAKALETLIAEGKIIPLEAGLWNERVEREIEKRSKKSEVGRENSNRRWAREKRKTVKKQDAFNATASNLDMQNRCLPETRYQIPEKNIYNPSSVAARDTADVETLPAELVDEAFVQFWQAYPHPPNRGSRARAEALFGKLSQPDRLAVLASLGPLRDYCAAAGWYTPKMAQTYLNPKNRHWEETPDAAAERNRSAARAGGAEDIFSLLGGDRRA